LRRNCQPVATTSVLTAKQYSPKELEKTSGGFFLFEARVRETFALVREGFACSHGTFARVRETLEYADVAYSGLEGRLLYSKVLGFVPWSTQMSPAGVWNVDWRTRRFCKQKSVGA
jgi:hypothetical protein